eukprot:CAMPEP_0178759912 /NCGR_PEP_ID=MMETSP0744-20121128/15199_1 /TAXON_ID=913974 /ORGANISM="Nitzschia punctata, Strain CCMP561" /LENGTH=270 /DNA_ID=CAMNT_0020414429 /DNA_START=447 /DNA_END=1259 /DNA_ORIENTATION=+
MGCGASTEAAAPAPAPAESAKPAGGGGGGGAPSPMPMAIMRNAHGVIRGAMKEIQEALDKNALVTATELWKKLYRFQELHMVMEEGFESKNAIGLFKLMDEKNDQAATKAGLHDQHTTLSKLEAQVQECLVTKPDLAKDKEVFPKFLADNTAHLVKEEEILMSAVQSMVKGGVPVKKHIKTDLMPILLEGDNMEFFLKFANETLETYEKVEEPPKPKVRVFGMAVWAVASPDQWKQWSAWIEESLSEAKYKQVDGAIQAFKAEQASKASS